MVMVMTEQISVPMKDPTTYLEYTQCQRLENSTDSLRNKLILSLLWRCGLRVSEVAGLKKKDILIDKENPKESILLVLSKGKKKHKVRQRVFIDASIQPLLGEYIEHFDNNNHIFPTWSKSGHISRRQIYNILKKAGEKSGVMFDKGGKPIHPHTLRHSLAIFLIKQGVKLPKIQQILRHKSLAATSYYLVFSQKEIAADYHKAFENVRGGNT